MPKNSATLAFDRATVRSVDQDGRMHISLTNISKANISPYLGSEIPDAETLGLDPNKVYQLLRDPKELEKAAPTFNNLQLLYAHKPVHVEDPQKEITVGSTGTDAIFEYPYLKNSLVVWDAEAIETIENGSQREISCAYHYVADMTPGTFEGTPYDGIMREIRGNHVALVAQGRAGSDVVVQDHLPEELQNMKLSKKALLTKGALMAVLPATKLAQDATLDFDKLLNGVTNANWMKKKPGIVKAIKSKLAQDADLDSVIELLDKLDGEEPVEEPTVDAEFGSEEGMEGGTPESQEDEEKSLIAQLKELIGTLTAMHAPAATDEFPPKDEDEDDPDMKKKEDEKKEPGISKPAMDAAIAIATKKVQQDTIARMRAVTAAEEAVKPYVGKLAVAMDSADDVYKAALEVLGVDCKDVHPSAYRHILLAQPKPGSQFGVAQDSVPVTGISELFPNLFRLNA